MFIFIALPASDSSPFVRVKRMKGKKMGVLVFWIPPSGDIV